MTAIQKWQRYRRPPWKLILSLFIVICTTTQVILFSLYIAPYIRDTKAAFQKLLEPPDDTISTTEVGQTTTYHIYTIPSLYSSMKHVSTTYYTQRNVSLDYYGYDDEGYSGPGTIEIDVNRYSAGAAIFDTSVAFNRDDTTDHYTLFNERDIDTIWNNNISSIVRSVRYIQMKFTLTNYNLEALSEVCYNWQVTPTYYATTSGKVDLEIKLDPDTCHIDERNGHMSLDSWASASARDGVVALLVLILAFCFLSQALYFKALYRDIQMLHMRVSANAPLSYVSDSTRAGGAVPGADRGVGVVMFDGSVPISEAIRYVNAWFIIATVGNILNITSACYCLSRGILASNDTPWLAVMGFGVMAAWLSMTQFFESTSTYYILIETMQNGIPRVGRFLLGILPIFFAYAVFGVAYFSSYSNRFSTMDNACVTLFSLLNGDVIHDVFDDLHANSPIVSRVYLYSFIALFIYAVLNIFVAIIEDSFFATKAVTAGEDEPERDRRNNMLLLDLLDEDILPKNPKDEKKHAHGEAHDDKDQRAGYYKTLDNVASTSTATSPTTKGPTALDAKNSDLDTKHGEGAEDGVLTVVSDDYFNSVRSGAAGDLRRKGNDPKEFSRIMEALDKVLIDDLKREFSQVSLEMKFPSKLLRPPHDNGFYPCGFDDCLYCAVRTALLRNLDVVRDEVKERVLELLELMKREEDEAKHARHE